MELSIDDVRIRTKEGEMARVKTMDEGISKGIFPGFVNTQLKNCIFLPAQVPNIFSMPKKMISSVLQCFSGGTKSGLHVRGQIKSKANCTHFTIQHPMNITEK